MRETNGFQLLNKALASGGYLPRGRLTTSHDLRSVRPTWAPVTWTIAWSATSSVALWMVFTSFTWERPGRSSLESMKMPGTLNNHFFQVVLIGWFQTFTREMVGNHQTSTLEYLGFNWAMNKSMYITVFLGPSCWGITHHFQAVINTAGCLGYMSGMEWNIIPSYAGDYFISHEIRITTRTSSIQCKVSDGFLVLDSSHEGTPSGWIRDESNCVDTMKRKLVFLDYFKVIFYFVQPW